MKQILLFLLFSFSLSAQVKGVVLDSISGKSIPYVGVFTSKPELNVSTNEKGKFKVEKLTKQDTLWFFTSGYEEKKIPVGELDKKIFLKPSFNKKNKENINLYNQKKEWIDFQTDSNNSFKTISSSSTNLKAYFVHGIRPSDKKFIVKNLSFNVVNLTSKTNIFKIRFFKADSLKNVKEEIQIKPIIIFVETSKKRESNNVYHTKTLQEINLLNEQIEIPKEGFFIAIELLNIKQNQLNTVISEVNGILISPSINTTNIETKVYQYVKGKWKSVEKTNYYTDFKISIASTQN